MCIDFLLQVFDECAEREAVIWRDEAFSYAWMRDSIARCKTLLQREQVPSGSVASLEADFSPNAVALMLALIEHGCVIVPLTSTVGPKKSEFREIAEVETIIEVGFDDRVRFESTGKRAEHELLVRLTGRQRPGLIVFSSGSTGKNKAIVHDFCAILEKFTVRRRALRTIVFLLFDHLGGINTLLHTLSNGGCVITVQDRSPDAVCRAIEMHAAELLPTSPTFINLLLLSEAYARYDLSTLKLVTYGTEVMPESTLARFHRLFPEVQLQQTYGLSELGVLRSISRSSDSLWVKIGGEGFETRVVDGMLEIKANSAMLGYLNHPSPFTEDGWFRTGDVVEVDGDYLRFRARASEIINVGGEKVYPAEVESVIQLMDGVEDVVVGSEPNAITGHIVKAKVRLNSGETAAEFSTRMRRFCRGKLHRYKIPQKVVLVKQGIHGERYKKMRTA